MQIERLQDEMVLVGLCLTGKTTNNNGQSNIDCGSLWQKFEEEDCFEKISGRITEEIFAVYHDYESDHNGPFSYFIGCRVAGIPEVPKGLVSLTIPAGKYQKIKARGEMPGCIATAWKEIWSLDISRAYTFDFEVYDERSKNWNHAEVDIMLSIV